MAANPNCRLCPLGGTGSSTCVWGRIHIMTPNPAKHDAMVVGEAPDQQEDRRGTPFVGPRGRLLEEVLEAANLSDVYLTNVVKCFPGRQTKPKPAEIKACLPYLDEEIATIKPKAILALGETAWHRLGGKGGITDNEGKEIWSDKYNCWIMPARHPAFILRSMGHKSSWQQTILRFGTLLSSGLHKVPPVRVMLIQTHASMLRLQGALISAPSIVYDFETVRLPWWHKDFKALTVSFTISPGQSYVMPLMHRESPFDASCVKDFFNMIQPAMLSVTQKKTAHQGIFDDLVWYRLAGYLPHLTFDTLAGAHALDENRPRGLKWLGRALLGWPDWGVDTKDLDAMPLVDVARYNGYDTGATWELRDLLIDELKKDPRVHGYVASVLMPGLRTVEQIIANGVHVNQTVLATRTVTLETRRAMAATKIPVVNPGSRDQVAKWLYEDLKLPVHATTPTGKPSTDEETIQRLALSDKRVLQLLEYRASDKNLGTYLNPVKDALAVSYDGRMHYDIKLGPKTGRFASRFHTTPRDKLIRSIYDMPPGSVLLQGDYRQVEARLVAWAAAGMPAGWDSKRPNQNFLNAFMDPSRDVYREMAARVTGKVVNYVTDDERQKLGKVPTLAMLYDISAQGLADYAWREYQIEWTKIEAMNIHQAFFSLWPEVRTWQQREENVVQLRGWTQSALGRKIRLPDALAGFGTAAHEAMKTGLNMPIQSLASDLTLTAATTLQGMLKNNASTKIVGFIHDALLIQTKVAYAPTASYVLETVMLDAPNRLRLIGLRLPPGLIQVEIHAGPWGSKQTVEQYLQTATPVTQSQRDWRSLPGDIARSKANLVEWVENEGRYDAATEWVKDKAGDFLAPHPYRIEVLRARPGS